MPDRLLSAASNLWPTSPQTRAEGGRALILNSFESLEGPVLSRIRTLCPVTYGIGPLHVLAKTFNDGGADVAPSTNSASLWQEDRSCTAWLDAQPEKSVVYVRQLRQCRGVVEGGADGILAGASGQWQTVLMGAEAGPGGRDGRGSDTGGAGEGDKGEGVPCGVGTAGRGAGPPGGGMFLDPQWVEFDSGERGGRRADDLLACLRGAAGNSRFVSEIWRIGADMKNKRGRSVVERMVREVMEGERAEELRRSAGEMAELARKSVAEGGSSYMDVLSLVERIKVMSSKN